MSVPNEIDFALIRLGDAAEPTESFTLICGIDGVDVQETVNTSRRFRKDCAKPNKPPLARSRSTGYQWDISGNGVSNVDQFPLLKSAMGVTRSYEIPCYRDDGTDGGEELGKFVGTAMLTARNISTTTDGDSSMSINLEGQDDLVWVPA